MSLDQLLRGEIREGNVVVISHSDIPAYFKIMKLKEQGKNLSNSKNQNEDENQIVNLEKRNALINVKYDLNQEIQDCNNDLKRISDKY